MNYWLMKSEPSTFSIDDLIRKQIDSWEGVRNYQVRNMLRNQIKQGDRAFFYHSNCKPPGIVGIMEIIKNGYPDVSAFDPESPYYYPKSSPEKPIWYRVDVKFIQKFPQLISLDELKKHPELKEMLVLQKGSRLSITPVTPTQWNTIARISAA